MALVRLAYLKVYRDRYGTVRRYFRRPGQKDIRLKGEPGTAEFMLAYQAAFDRTTPLLVDTTKAGTFARLITEYRRSAAFANSSRRRRSFITSSLIVLPTVTGIASCETRGVPTRAK
jgi:hypothetical protein